MTLNPCNIFVALPSVLKCNRTASAASEQIFAGVEEQRNITSNMVAGFGELETLIIQLKELVQEKNEDSNHIETSKSQ
ncbi:hypothetical protein [Paenibacillus sp. 8b26]|uniref:hypothetical protein n=1 Tax=Paenibacillus sp. 8b26 TaxID=3424133 RepID=UPI003D6585F0